MEKKLLTIEFRYIDKPKGDYDCEYKSKKITIGIYDTLDEAIIEGNKVLDILSKSFEVRSDDKFQHNWLFGRPKDLVTNTCYKDNIKFFAKIETLYFDDLNETISETFKAFERYKEFKRSEVED